MRTSFFWRRVFENNIHVRTEGGKTVKKIPIATLSSSLSSLREREASVAPVLRPASNGAPVSENEKHRERISFEGFQLVRFPNGRSRAQVRVDWTGGRSYSGETEGNQTLEGEVRSAADATLKAASGATEGRLDLDLRGAKALRVFDAWVVVVMVRAWIEGKPLQLLGAYPCPDEDTPRGAAMAVLDATNRVLRGYLAE